MKVNQKTDSKRLLGDKVEIYWRPPKWLYLSVSCFIGVTLF